ncbi:MAG: TIGR03749 family integrating conjugative element protein, partial [Parahaliea sp.]
MCPLPPILVCLFLLFGAIPTSHAVEILTWERLPLTLPLVVGHERVVFIDRNVRVGVPTSIGDRLRLQSTGGALYLLAYERFEPTRLQLQDADDGTLILVDIAAQDGDGPLEPVRIVEGETHGTHSGGKGGGKDTQPSEAPGTAIPNPARETPVPVMLTRYAAQSLYAPLRTVEPVTGLSRGNLHRDLPLDTLLPTLPVRARALAAWLLEDHWVTAVRLTNTAHRWLSLDPRALQGSFVAATFQHPNLGPVGESDDTTVLYLVTRGHGLVQALLPAISPIDATRNLPAAAATGD